MFTTNLRNAPTNAQLLADAAAHDAAADAAHRDGCATTERLQRQTARQIRWLAGQ